MEVILECEHGKGERVIGKLCPNCEWERIFKLGNHYHCMHCCTNLKEGELVTDLG